MAKKLAPLTTAPTGGLLAEPQMDAELFAALHRLPADIPEGALDVDLVNSELHQRMTSVQRFALDRFVADAVSTLRSAPDRTHWMVARLARRARTLIVGHQLAMTMVVDYVGEEVARQTTSNSYDVAGEVEDAVESLRGPQRLVFEADEFQALAMLVQSRSPEPITAATAKDFYAGARSVPMSSIDVLIEAVIGEIEIWDNGRRQNAPLGRRLVAEVRAAIARMYHRPTGAGDTVQMIDVTPTTVFFERRLLPVPEAWTANESIWRAWVEECGGVEKAGDQAQFFKALVRWGRGRITPKRGSRPERVYGYAGVKLAAGGSC
jgi:hypothetical protein